MSQFERGQKVRTTENDPAFGFAKGEVGVVVGHDTISPDDIKSTTQFDPYEVVIVQFSGGITKSDPQSVKPEYLEAV